MVKNLPANEADVRDVGLIPGLGRSPGGGYGNPLQYSCLETPMDRGACGLQSRPYGTQLKRLCMHAYMLGILEEAMDFEERLSRYSFLLDMVKTHSD